jgi:uncharacterized protein (DUF1684 family)
MRKTETGITLGIISILLLLISAIHCSKENPEFVQAELQWRSERDQQMRSPTSWLTIAGLFWLEEGEHTFGTDPKNEIRLPEESAPAFAGTFILHDDVVKVVHAGDTEMTIEGRRINEQVLTSDASGKPDVIELNDLKMWVIKRGDRLAIRLRDLNAAPYKEYTGLEFFPPRAKYKLNASFTPYSPSKSQVLSTMVGTTTEMEVPGYLTFQIDGREYRLDAFRDYPESKDLFIIFKDGTSGMETYGASRFMDAEILEDGTVDLNFNRAYNPPCAYTHYATCPLPPPQNILTVRIEAGEKKYAKSH